MPVHDPLTPTELGYLTGAHTAAWSLVAASNAALSTAEIVLVNIVDAYFTISNFPTPPANWDLVEPGMTFLVSSGATLRGIYRIRDVTETTVYIMQIGIDDPGLLTIALRADGVQAGDTVTVYSRRDVWSVIPRILPLSDNIYEDFDETVTDANSAPGPLLNIYLNGQPGDLIAYTDSGLYSYATVTLTVTATVWPTATSISAYLWQVPAAWGAPVAGSTTAASVTYHVPAAGQTNYTISLTATDDGGSVSEGERDVWVLGRSTNTPIPVMRLDSLTSDRSGTRATITLNNTVYTQIPGLGDKIVLFAEVKFGGHVIDSAWVKVMGWVTRAVESSTPGNRSVTLDIAGPDGMLAQLGSFSQFIRATASDPDTWQQIDYRLAYIDYLIYWCASVRAKNLSAIVNWTQTGVTSTDQRLPSFIIAKANNLFQQMGALAARRQSSVGFNPDGTLTVRRHPSLIPYADRAGDVVTRLTLTAAMYQSVTFNRTNYPQVQWLMGEAFAWNGIDSDPIPYLASSPGAAFTEGVSLGVFGQGTSVDRLQNQIVTIQDELNQVTGDQYALLNNPYPSIEIRMRGLYGLLIYCAELSFIELQVAAQFRPDNTAVDMNVIPRSVTIQELQPGLFTSTIEAEAETTGHEAITVIVPTQATTTTTYTNPPPVVIPDDPAIVPTRSGKTVIAGDTSGNLGICYNTDRGGWISLNSALPLGTAIGYFKLDPFSPFFLNPSDPNGALGIWVVDDSYRIWYKSNVFNTASSWSNRYSGITVVGGADILLRPSANKAGDLAFYICNGTEPFVCHPVTSTAGGLLTFGASLNQNYLGIDQDIYGRYETILAIHDGDDGSGLYRMLNSTLRTYLGADTNNAFISHVEKPVLTFDGVANSGVGTGELLFWAGNFSPKKIYRSLNGGIGPEEIGSFSVSAISIQNDSIAFTANPKFMAFAGSGGSSGIYTCNDASVLVPTWENKGGDGRNWFGMFPRLINGQIQLYFSNNAQIMYSPDFGTTQLDITDNWNDVFGSTGPFYSVIPLY